LRFLVKKRSNELAPLYQALYYFVTSIFLYLGFLSWNYVSFVVFAFE